MNRIGVVCHFHSERHALPGFIEAAEQMFDEIILVSSPMDGTPPDPGTIKIAEASGHKLIYDTLNQGFGALRTRCIGYSSCEWVMIADADERLWPSAPELSCTGFEKFPHTLTPDLKVTRKEKVIIDQREGMRNLTYHADAENALAICLSRRHWFGAPDEWDRPCQNWTPGVGEPDWQLRLVKNSPYLCYDPEVKMHERLLFTPHWSEPKFVRVSDGSLFIDHYSWHYKNLEPAQNVEDAEIYEALAPGSVKDMWLNHYLKTSA